jgi:hypothetical protein
MPTTSDKDLQNGLAVYYLLVALMNLGFAAYYFYGPKNKLLAAVWAGVACLFLVHTIAYFAKLNWIIPQSITDGVNRVMDATVYTSVSIGLFVVLLVFRKFFVRPQVSWTLLNLSLLGFGWGMTNPNFFSIVAKADNVPITMLIYCVAFFTWLGMYWAVRNDDRIARGEPPIEKLDDEKVLVWPDLVYTELICMIIATFVLVVWAVLLKAPLEPPATSAKAPNPSKAPWYFLGLQEMLVYYDPWYAGVWLPTFIILGLIAIPYIDFNRKGNGYFSFKERWFAVSTFQFGFIVLWVVLIVLGTFLRGPNWNFFGPFEYWDAHKVDPLLNRNVSEMFWLGGFGKSPDDFKLQYGNTWGPLLREAPGIVIVLAYMMLLPPLLARTVMRGFFIKMGFLRFIVLVTLLQFMASLPIKMVLRWTLNLKYIVAFPEYFFNI